MFKLFNIIKISKLLWDILLKIKHNKILFNIKDKSMNFYQDKFNQKIEE